MRALIASLCGLIFGAGLAISGMTNPAKVLAFLDVFGAWDPTLAFVMGAALAVSAAGYLVVRGRDRAWLGDAFAIPTRRDLDPALVGGAALFGVGWGLVGLCPGPALANLSRGSLEIWVFVGAMLVGIVGTRVMTRERSATSSTAHAEGT
jgi:uncharacterized membrane protein YedE/YeeE